MKKGRREMTQFIKCLLYKDQSWDFLESPALRRQRQEDLWLTGSSPPRVKPDYGGIQPPGLFSSIQESENFAPFPGGLGPECVSLSSTEHFCHCQEQRGRIRTSVNSVKVAPSLRLSLRRQSQKGTQGCSDLDHLFNEQDSSSATATQDSSMLGCVSTVSPASGRLWMTHPL